ncbi:MAG: aldehyde dehydrogenase family protein [Acidimicrobiia bacterium]
MNKPRSAIKRRRTKGRNLNTPTLRLFIDGTWTPSSDSATFETFDPATEEVVANVARGTREDVDRAIHAARKAVDGEWRATLPKRRVELLYELSRALEGRAEEFAELETRDSGKPIQRSRREIASTVRYFRYYAGAADKVQGSTIPLGPDYLDFTLREPLGVTAHIIPWNAPLNMIGRSVAAALAVGNTAVVKPATETPLTALLLGELFEQVGIPAGVYNVVTGPGSDVGAYLTHHPEIDGITFTGSIETGRQVMHAAAEHITPLVLELGGKSPSLIFADADIASATAQTVKGIYSNSGQFCNACSRLIVHSSIKDQVIHHLVEQVSRLRIGPGIEGTDMGPLISQTQYDRVLNFIRIGQEDGAELIAGGGRPVGLDRGYFIAPTILDRVGPDTQIAQEEIFGPVLAILTFDDEDEAITLANNTPYGLAAGIFTKDLNRALRLATNIRAGQIYVNEYFAGGEETPFGGYKQSGFGREKGLEALLHYTQTKNVAIRIY